MTLHMYVIVGVLLCMYVCTMMTVYNGSLS